jgi:hypothetical protein
MNNKFTTEEDAANAILQIRQFARDSGCSQPEYKIERFGMIQKQIYFRIVRVFPKFPV